MFGRRDKTADQDPSSTPSGDPQQGSNDDPQAAKGRPTPSRKEAEAARKQSLKVPKDPKEAKRAMRERERQARAANRTAMLAGDQRALPARDQGPVRAAVRDFVDGRSTLAEYFIFAALGVLFIGLFGGVVPGIQVYITLAFYLFLVLIIVDLSYLVWKLNRVLAVEFPNKADRKGVAFYAIMRSIQMRRLRIPKPRVRRGGLPVVPKGK